MGIASFGIDGQELLANSGTKDVPDAGEIPCLHENLVLDQDLFQNILTEQGSRHFENVHS